MACHNFTRGARQTLKEHEKAEDDSDMDHDFRCLCRRRDFGQSLRHHKQVTAADRGSNGDNLIRARRRRKGRSDLL